MSRSNPIKSAAKNYKIMVVIVGCWTKMVLLIVTAGYTEASKIQTTGPLSYPQCLQSKFIKTSYNNMENPKFSLLVKNDTPNSA